MRNKLKNKKYKISKTYIVLMVIFLSVICVFSYNLIATRIVKGSHDVKISEVFDKLPDDTLLKSYSEYKDFIRKYLSDSEYKKEITDKSINSKSFDNNDYVAIFYESKACKNTESLNKVTKTNNKIVLSVTRYEESGCDNSNRILFVPIEDNHYDSLPNIVIRKNVINK